jgi:hypothetical protein
MIIKITMKLPSLANTRMHWRAMDRLKKSQKEIVACYLHGQPLPDLPAIVTLTRTGTRKLDDDNLSGAFKYVRDEIARRLAERLFLAAEVLSILAEKKTKREREPDQWRRDRRG